MKKKNQNISLVLNGSTNERTDERRKVGIKQQDNVDMLRCMRAKEMKVFTPK